MLKQYNLFLFWGLSDENYPKRQVMPDNVDTLPMPDLIYNILIFDIHIRILDFIKFLCM
jgi:hypothetical protein